MRSYRRFDLHATQPTRSEIGCLRPHDLNLTSGLESTPIPVSCETLRNTTSLSLWFRGGFDRFAHRPAHWPSITRHSSSLINPPLILPPAIFTAPTDRASWMELGVLIQWYHPDSMHPTENIPAMPTMMPPLEEGEMFLADGRVAKDGVGV